MPAVTGELISCRWVALEKTLYFVIIQQSVCSISWHSWTQIYTLCHICFPWMPHSHKTLQYHLTLPNLRTLSSWRMRCVGTTRATRTWRAKADDLKTSQRPWSETFLPFISLTWAYVVRILYLRNLFTDVTPPSFSHHRSLLRKVRTQERSILLNSFTSFCSSLVHDMIRQSQKRMSDIDMDGCSTDKVTHAL